jgi:hypothetical protein
MNDGPYKLHTGYLVEGIERFIRKVIYTKYDATVLVRWACYTLHILEWLRNWRLLK